MCDNKLSMYVRKNLESETLELEQRIGDEDVNMSVSGSEATWYVLLKISFLFMLGESVKRAAGWQST